jgi:hypothetical protein
MTLLMKRQSSGLQRALRTGIAKRLRETYEPVIKEEIPPRHRDLMRQIEPREQLGERTRGKAGAAANRQ